MGLYDPQPHIGGTGPDLEDTDALLATEEEAAALADLIGFHATYEVHYLPETDSRRFVFHLQVHARAGVTEEQLREVPDLEEAAAQIRAALLEGARRTLFPGEDDLLAAAWDDNEMLSRVHGYDPKTFNQYLGDLRAKVKGEE